MITKILGNNEDNSFWIGSDEGIGYYDGESWSYYGYDQGLDSSFVTDIALVNETVWAGTHYGGYDGSGLTVSMAKAGSCFLASPLPTKMIPPRQTPAP